jgi:N-acetylglucosamine-6-phosphate deacetylase
VRLRSERIVTRTGTIAGEVVVRDGRIVSVGPVAVGRGPEIGTESVEVVDLGTRWLVPGLIDLHVHGGGGAQCNTADADEVAAVARFHGRHGVTGLLATTVAAAPDELVGALGAIRAAMDHPTGGADVLGAHLEGPFLHPRWPGAMDPAVFLDPEPAVLRRLVLAGGGCLALMTVAPELPRALGLISELVQAGVVVSLGHSGATYDEARAAIGAGARSVTHLFNAMTPFHHRAPGLVGAALESADVSCELICDGVHVNPVAARLAYRMKGPAGIHLVSDAIAAAGMADGDHWLGHVAVTVADGRATVAGTDILAGSTLTLDAAVANAVRVLDIGVEEAVGLASGNPAALLGLEDRKGAIAPGYDADLTVLDDALRAVGTVVSGRWVHRASEL